MLGIMALGALGLAASFLSEGGKSVNKKAEEEIEEIYSSMQVLSEKTESQIEKVKADNKKALSLLNRRKRSIYDTTFKTFSENAKNITNIQFNSNIHKTASIKMKSDLSNVYIPDAPESILTGGVGTFINMLSPVGGFISQISYSFKLDNIKAEAESEYAQLQLECELAKKECLKIKSITRLMITVASTAEVFKKLADNANQEMITITEKSGYDFSAYDEKEQKQIWLTFSLIDALNKLINMEIITKEGKVNSKLRKFIGELNQTYLEEANG